VWGVLLQTFEGTAQIHVEEIAINLLEANYKTQ
jgi:hypothetical protein